MTDVNAIEAKIPSQATAQNQLADKDFVNSSISTATADFKGTVNSVAALDNLTANNNDYAFVVTTDQAGNIVYKRYKYNGTTWLFEYDLNNSSFTAAQWATINSGVTSQILENVAYIGEDGGEAVIPEFDPQTDTLLKTTQSLTNTEKETVIGNILDKNYNAGSYIGKGKKHLKLNVGAPVATDFDGFVDGATTEQSSLAEVPDNVYFDRTNNIFIASKDSGLLMKYYMSWQNGDAYMNPNSGVYFKNGNDYYQWNGTTLEAATVGNVNKLTQADFDAANTIYVIRYDFDLCGQSITIPGGCVLEFDGGSINNGNVRGNFFVKGNIRGNALFDNVRKFPLIYNKIDGCYLYEDILDGNIKDTITASLNSNDILYKFERSSLIQNLKISSSTNTGTAFSTAGITNVNPHENVFSNVKVSQFNIGLEITKSGYSTIQNSYFYKNNIGIKIGNSNSWSGGISIYSSRIYGNTTGMQLENIGTTFINNCIFEWNLCGIKVNGGSATFTNCYFGDTIQYVGDISEGFRIAVVGPGSTVIFDNCALGISSKAGTQEHFAFELKGTDDNPCTIILRNCSIALDAQSLGNLWFYKSDSSKNNIVIDNCTLSLSKVNKQHTWKFPELYNNICCNIVESYVSKNYIIDGYFQDETQLNQLAKLSNVTILDDLNIYGGKKIKITPYICNIFYKIPKEYVGKPMVLEFYGKHNNANAPRVSYDESDCTETGKIDFLNGIINIASFTPTKEIGSICFRLGPYDTSSPSYITLDYVKLVSKKFSRLADKLPSVNDIIYLPSSSINDFSDIISNRTLYNTNGKIENIENVYNKYIKKSGTFANKPASADIYVGFKYFCTDKQTTEGATDGIEIIHKGNDVWVDTLGRTIS